MKLAIACLNRGSHDSFLFSLRLKMPMACPDITFVDNYDQADAVILRLFDQAGFQFDHDLADRISKKRIIFLDFFEHGHRPIRDSLFGHLTDADWELHPNRQHRDQYFIFDSYIRAFEPVLYYKRELALNTRWKHVRPIEYLAFNMNEPYVLENEEEFNARTIPLFYSWGPNHISRSIFHGYLIQRYTELNQKAPLMALEDLGRDHKRWMLLYVPEYLRVCMAKLLSVQSRSKLSISLAGGGQKCFRDVEASYNAVMARQAFTVEHTYPWVDGENCIILPTVQPDGVMLDCDKAFAKIMEALSRPDLYTIYRNGLETWKKYWWRNYLPMLAAQWTQV